MNKEGQLEGSKKEGNDDGKEELGTQGRFL